jgi:hypothetical protein
MASLQMFVCLREGGLKVHWLAIPVVCIVILKNPTCDGVLMPEVNCTSSYIVTYILVQDLFLERKKKFPNSIIVHSVISHPFMRNPS